jgi:hypothetical protein
MQPSHTRPRQFSPVRSLWTPLFILCDVASWKSYGRMVSRYSCLTRALRPLTPTFPKMFLR